MALYAKTKFQNLYDPRKPRKAKKYEATIGWTPGIEANAQAMAEAGKLSEAQYAYYMGVDPTKIANGPTFETVPGSMSNTPDESIVKDAPVVQDNTVTRVGEDQVIPTQAADGFWYIPGANGTALRVKDPTTFNKPQIGDPPIAVDDNGNPVSNTGTPVVTPTTEVKTTPATDPVLPTSKESDLTDDETRSNDLNAKIKELQAMDWKNLKRQGNATKAQMIAGSLTTVANQLVNLTADRPEDIAAPQLKYPDTEYSNDIFQEQSKNDLAALMGTRQFLAQRGAPEASVGALADYYGQRNQVNAQEATAQSQFLSNQEAINTGIANEQEKMNYGARVQNAAAQDAFNKERALNLSTGTSENLANIFGGIDKLNKIDAEYGKSAAIFAAMEQAIKDKNWVKLADLQAALGGINLTTGNDLVSETGFRKNAGGKQ